MGFLQSETARLTAHSFAVITTLHFDKSAFSEHSSVCFTEYKYINAEHFLHGLSSDWCNYDA